MTGARIGVYAGEGSSHSWLWLADLFGTVETLDEKSFAGAIEGLDLVCVSGGDTFGLAHALGRSGAEALRRFVEGGGTYLGICAGACLCLRSSREPLSWFNLTDGTIANIAERAPDPLWRSVKYSCTYGACEVFHPVRGEVVLQTGPEGGRVVAPLYGGPAIQPAADMRILAAFSGFTRGTSFLTDEETARSVYVGRGAIVEKRLGLGRLLLSSPHLEHPAYPAANVWLAQRLLGLPVERAPSGHAEAPAAALAMDLPPESLALRSAASDLRIACHGLLPLGGWWEVGAKLYDAERLHTFADFFWRRHASVERERERERAGLAERAGQAAREVARFRMTVKDGEPDLARLAAILTDMRELCARAARGRAFA